MPCLNEVKTLGGCIADAQRFLENNSIPGEIIVADNGSLDGSKALAIKHGAKLVHVKEKGHGHALHAGIMAASGYYVIMGDSDASYDFLNLKGFMEKFEAGCEMVIGNRYQGGIEKKAMPFAHRYLGNPVLSLLNRLLFGNSIGDVHGGLRGFKKSAYEKLNIQSRDMAFCTEMIARASIKGVKLDETPIVLRPDGRDRKPHLRTWKDGWSCLQCSLSLWIQRKEISVEQKEKEVFYGRKNDMQPVHPAHGVVPKEEFLDKNGLTRQILPRPLGVRNE